MYNKDLDFEIMLQKDGEYLLLKCDGETKHNNFYLYVTDVDLDESLRINNEFNTECLKFPDSDSLKAVSAVYVAIGYMNVQHEIEDCVNGRFYRID